MNSIASPRLIDASLTRDGRRDLLWQVPAGLAASLVGGGLVGVGLWPLAVALLVGIPAVTLLHRHPLAGISAWLIVLPLVVNTDLMSVRAVYWLIHRLLPVALLLVLVARPLVMEHTKPLNRVGWAELMAIGYVVASLISIAYTSADATATTIHLYDRVAMPVCLYLAVRLIGPDREDIRRWLLPAIVVMLGLQIVVGVLSWAMPGVLPGTWSADGPRARTVGTLREVAVYGVVVIFGALVLLDHAATARRRTQEILAYLGFCAGMIMVFLTLSRGSWLAGLLAIGGALVLHRRRMGRALLVVASCAVLLASSGLLTSHLDFATARLVSEESEESALARLPVVVASVRMAQERPVVGFGWGNFDSFDRDYQGPVFGYYPEKDQASHNLYLTVLAEQGVIGLLLFLGPAVYWLARTRAARRRGPLDPGASRLTAVLWLSLLAHVTVNSFHNMREVSGLGLWWLTLGLVGALITSLTADEAVQE